MAGDLSGAWAKWGRANAHLEAVKEKAVGNITFTNEWLYSYRAVPEAHRDGLEYRFYVEPEPLDTGPVALLVGDFLFNLRSALDHIVFELHRRHFRDRIPDDAVRDSAFPLLTVTPREIGRSTDTAKWKEIKRLSVKHRRAIAFLQPYHRWNDKYRRIREALGAIEVLNNIDKHRHLHVLQATLVTAPVPIFGDVQPFIKPAPYGFEHHSLFGKPLEGKTEVFRWTFDTVPPDIAVELNREHHVTAGVCLYEGEVAGPFILSLLKELADRVESVLKRFEVFWPPTQDGLKGIPP